MLKTIGPSVLVGLWDSKFEVYRYSYHKNPINHDILHIIIMFVDVYHDNP